MRSMGAIGQILQALIPVPAHPAVHRLTRHPEPLGNLGDRHPGLNLQHSPIPLLRHGQLHQHSAATLMDAQMGHADGSVRARYSHITSGMTERLLDGLTERWTAALDARREFSPGSPGAVLDRLLRERAP